MLLVGLNLSGVYEIPMLFARLGQQTAGRSSLVGSLATGGLAVLVATPCTAPFMAPAIGFALTQSSALSLSVFAALGAGMAAPFLLVSVWPRLWRVIPKPGLWMIRLRQFLAFPMYATAGWLLWVLTRQADAQALAIVLALAVLIATLVWIIGVAASAGNKRILTGLLVLVVALGLESLSRLDAVSALEALTRPYSQARLAALRENDEPVFVYATADWCITCKVNERVALNTEQVTAHFQSHGITVLRADWTDYDAAITRFLKQHGRAGVPLYVYYPPTQGEPVVLPQLLSPSGVVERTGGG
jgi:thiol:disulfide interchange protein DsbD